MTNKVTIHWYKKKRYQTFLKNGYDANDLIGTWFNQNKRWWRFW